MSRVEEKAEIAESEKSLEGGPLGRIAHVHNRTSEFNSSKL